MATQIAYPFADRQLDTIKLKMLAWLRPFSIFSYLDNNRYSNGPNRYECIMAAGAVRHYTRLQDIPSGNNWHFGHLNYDHKNQIDPTLRSQNPGSSPFPDCFFFQPEIVCYIPHGRSVLYIDAPSPTEAHKTLEEILAQTPDWHQPSTTEPVFWKLAVSPEDYRDTIKKIQNDIVEGDYYELNYCIQSEAAHPLSDPLATFISLNRKNPAPFAACYRHHHAYLLCASPERFLWHDRGQLIAQPIKGTAASNPNPAVDAAIKTRLRKNIKETAENVMITDLMRNDLARCCDTGSISVPELFGVYTFPHLHHLISTVEGRLRTDCHIAEIMAHTFPMGSMTGAPKKIVMERIDRYENRRRGLYAGTVGYIEPNGNFDFNVVIRSLQYDADTPWLAYHTGGAITFDSDPDREWDEVILKAAAISALFS